MQNWIFLQLIICMVALPTGANSAVPDAVREIVSFNRSFENATRKMDTDATLALWAADGISLLPSTKPILGKAAIATFLSDVMASLKGAQMVKFEMACFDIVVSADWASEWCTEHQVVQFPDGKPAFDGRGKMLLVLRRGTQGAWRIEREMWNQAEPPGG